MICVTVPQCPTCLKKFAEDADYLEHIKQESCSTAQWQVPPVNYPPQKIAAVKQLKQVA